MLYKRLLLVWLSLAIAPSKAQDVDHLRMELLYAHDSLKITATYSFTATVATDSLFFVLNPGYPLTDLRSEGLASFEIGQRPDRPFPGYVLRFEEGIQPGNIIDLNFAYSFDLQEQNHLRSDWIELNVDKLWFPNRGDIDNRFTSEVVISQFPSEYELVSHMDARVDLKEGGIHIRQDNPVQEVLILAGPRMRLWKPSESMEFFSSRDVPDSVVYSMEAKVRSTIDFFNQTLGESRPITDFRVVLRNTSKKELGYQFNRKNMIITGPEFDHYGNLSHEVAHFWWSDADFIKEPWMNESFANYFMFLVLERFDPDDYKSLLQYYRETGAKAPPVATATLFSENAYQSYYHKGGVLLKDLEERIGKQDMFQVIRNCIEKDIHTTAGFLNTLEKQTTREVREEFELAMAK